jgi:hypothetical protein
MTTVTEEWVSLWYQCLSQNIDYSLYCNARESGDAAKCREYEARFDKVAEIYDDFGTMDAWPEEGIQCPYWKKWFEARKHLFMDAARHVTDPAQYVVREGFVLLEIPMQVDAKSTGTIVDTFLTRHFENNDVVPAPKAKYKLYENSARSIQRVRQACRSVVRSYLYDLDTADELKRKDAIKQFVRHEIDNMEWSIDPRTRKELMKSGTLPDDRYESYRVMLNKCRRDFRAYAANTIRGSFPDDRPFESNVQDIF